MYTPALHGNMIDRPWGWSPPYKRRLTWLMTPPERKSCRQGFRGAGRLSSKKGRVHMATKQGSTGGGEKGSAKAMETRSSGLPPLLAEVRAAAADLGPDFHAYGERIGALAGRLEEGRFHLAVLSQFKRGKSTLLNALLGEEILPTSVLPATAIPTFLRFHPARRAQVHFRDRRAPLALEDRPAGDMTAFLARFVTERANPENRLGVDHVEVGLPASLLEAGVVLIDTPGIGSTFRHNTATTLECLGTCDAALFLVSADPPLTEAELSFLSEVRAKVPRLFFALNKVDYLGPEERDEAAAFFQKILHEEAGVPVPCPLFCISARWGLKARREGNEEAWRESGLLALEEHLLRFLAREKQDALREAVARKAAALAGEMLLEVDLRIRSLRMPLHDLEERSRRLTLKIEEARRQRETAGDLLAGDRKRTAAFLEEQACRLRDRARAALEATAREAVEGAKGTGRDEAAQEALARAIPALFDQEFAACAEAVSRRVEKILEGHAERADALVEEVRRTAAELFEIPYRSGDKVDAFALSREPCWVTRQWNATLSPFPPGAFEALLPPGLRKARVLKRVLAGTEALVRQNTENLRWSLLQSMNDAFFRFGTRLDERLKQAVAATHGAVEAAVMRRRERSEAVEGEVERLERSAAKLAALQETLEA